MCYDKDKPGKHYTKSGTKAQTPYDLLTGGTWDRQTRRNRAEMWWPGPAERGAGELLQECSLWDDEKVLDTDSGGVCTILWRYLMPLDFILKEITTVNFNFAYITIFKKPYVKKKNYNNKIIGDK